MIDNKYSSVIFQSDLNDEDLEFEFFSNPKEQKFLNKKSELINPYDMNRLNVRMYHFKDARLHDTDITEPGWQIQKWSQRKKYNQWVSSIRRLPGWRNFHRLPKPNPQGKPENNNKIGNFQKLPHPARITDNTVNNGMIVNNIKYYRII